MIWGRRFNEDDNKPPCQYSVGFSGGKFFSGCCAIHPIYIVVLQFMHDPKQGEILGDMEIKYGGVIEHSVRIGKGG